MPSAPCTITVDIHIAPFRKRLRNFPKVWRSHYHTLRQYNGRLVSAWVSWKLTGLIFTVGGKEHGGFLA